MSRRQLAQFLFRVAGWLTRVKTLQFHNDEVWWAPCELSMRVLSKSMHLDWDHWDHWAARHEDCGGTRCPECGGIDCFLEEDERV